MPDSSRLDSGASQFPLDPAFESERQLLLAQLKALQAEEKALLTEHSLAKLAYLKANPGRLVKLDMGDPRDRHKVLLEGESRFESFIEGAVLPIYKVDSSGRITYANQAMAKYLGYPRHELMSGQISEEQITPRDRQAIDASHVSDLRSNLISNVWESERLNAQGKRLAVGVTLRQLDEELAEHVVFILDLQELRELEDELKQRQTLFSALVQEMPHIVFVSGAEGRMRQFNKRFYELTGNSPASDEGLAWRRAIHEEDLEKWDKRWQNAVEHNSSFSGEFRICASDGDYYWHIVRALPLVNPLAGQIDGLLKITIDNATSSENFAGRLWIGTATDIDRRKRLMEEVLESAHVFQSLADQIPQIVWTAGPDGRLDFFSNRWYEFSGLTREHRVGLDFALFMHPDDRKEYMSNWRRCVKTGDAFEADVRLKARVDQAQGDGWVRFLARAVALRNYRGGIAQWVGTWTSID